MRIQVNIILNDYEIRWLWATYESNL